MKKSIVEILKEVLTKELSVSRWSRDLAKDLLHAIEENLEASELAEIQELVVKTKDSKLSNLLSDETIKKMSKSELKNVSDERLMRIKDPDWWRSLIKEDVEFVIYCPHIDIIQEVSDNNKQKITLNYFYRREDIPLKLRARFFARSRTDFFGVPFSVVIESFPYREDNIANCIRELYLRVASRFVDIVREYLSDWPEDFIRKYWNVNIYFKKFALLSRHCPEDLIVHALQFSNFEVKAAVLTNPNCPPACKLRYSQDKFLNSYTTVNKTKETFEDFIL